MIPQSEPNKPGKWSFTGKIWFPDTEAYKDATRMSFDVVEIDGKLYAQDDRGNAYVIPMFIGWWVSQEGERND